MRQGDISDSLYCLGAACAKDLPDIQYQSRGPGDKTTITKTRRPYASDVEVYSFPQVWGSTALGFGGMGGSAMTSAQTTVIFSELDVAVYFSRRLAYVTKRSGTLMEDLNRQRMASVKDSRRYNPVEPISLFDEE